MIRMNTIIIISNIITIITSNITIINIIFIIIVSALITAFVINFNKLTIKCTNQ